MKKIIFALFILVAFGCKDDEVSPNTLINTWQIERGVYNGTEKVAGEDWSVEMTFKKDSSLVRIETEGGVREEIDGVFSLVGGKIRIDLPGSSFFWDYELTETSLTLSIPKQIEEYKKK